ncbi:MAG: hypothetical protein ACP5E4_00875 [Candidatus Aenigmatarchaeota archaeon]
MAAKKKGILDLKALSGKLPCHEKDLFGRFYEVEASNAKLSLPKDMLPWVKKNFGSVKRVERQKVVHVSNRLTGEGALFNGIRASRPFDTTSKTLPDLEDKKSCLFCRPEKNTPKDVFGRVNGKHCVTASNVAKYDYFHAVLIFKEHNPLKLKREWLADYLETAEKWFKKVEKTDPKATHRLLMWNCLWRSGASIIHGHMQLTASKTEYGQIRHLREVAGGYREIFGTDYFEGLLQVHAALGLAKKSGKSYILAYLTPKKEKEIWIISEAKRFAALSAPIFGAVQKLKKLGVQTYNLALFEIDGWLVCRIVDRGELKNKSSDIGSMELFADSVIASDPFRVIEEI